MSDQKKYSVDDILEDISRSRGDAPRATGRQADVDRILEEILHNKKEESIPSQAPSALSEQKSVPATSTVPQADQIRRAVEKKVEKEFSHPQLDQTAEFRVPEKKKDSQDQPVAIRADAFFRAKKQQSSIEKDLPKEELSAPEEIKETEVTAQVNEKAVEKDPLPDHPVKEEKIDKDRPVYLSDLFVGDREEFLAQRRGDTAPQPAEEETSSPVDEPEEPESNTDSSPAAEAESSSTVERKLFVIDGDAVERSFAETEAEEKESAPQPETPPSKRELKIKGFVLSGEEDETEEWPEEDVVEEIEEYESSEDDSAVWADIRMLKLKLIVRIVILSIFSLFHLYLFIGDSYPALLPDALNASVQPLTYLLANFIALGVAAAVSYSVVGGGILSALRLKPDRDSVLALAVLLSLIQMAVCFFDLSALSAANVTIYAGIVVIGLLFNTFGKFLFAQNVYGNFKYVSSSYDKYALQVLDNEQMSVEMTRGLVDDFPFVAIRKKTGFLQDFIRRSNEEDFSDRLARFLFPICLGCGLIFGAISLLKGNSIYAALTVFAAVCCAFVPFGYLLSVSVPMFRVAKRLKKFGGVIFDTTEMEDYYDVNAVAVTAHDLFPEGSVQLFGIKTFSGTRIDEALLDAASVIHASGGILYDVFSEILAGDENLLRPVDTLVYEDAMGISAWVQNKRVLIGSRELMINHGIRVPSKDYEARYLNEGHELIYLSTGGELTAVFLVRLEAAPQITAGLKKLAGNDIKVVVKTVDAVISRQKLADLFDVSSEMFKIIPARLHEEYDRLNEECERISTSVAASEGFFSFANTLVIAKRFRTVLSLSAVIQVAAIILGLILIALFALIFTSGTLSPLSLLIYQLVWVAATVFVPMIKTL